MMGTVSITNPPVFVRERPKTGGFKYTEMGLRFRASKARKPYPLWGIFKYPFPQERVLEAAFLWYLSFAEAKESSPKSETI
jgi:hypothetical protein